MLVVELFVDVLRCNFARVGSVDVSIPAVAEDCHDHHVSLLVSRVFGKLKDGPLELQGAEIMHNLDIKVQLTKQFLQVSYVILKDRNDQG